MSNPAGVAQATLSLALRGNLTEQQLQGLPLGPRSYFSVANSRCCKRSNPLLKAREEEEQAGLNETAMAVPITLGSFGLKFKKRRWLGGPHFWHRCPDPARGKVPAMKCWSLCSALKVSGTEPPSPATSGVTVRAREAGSLSPAFKVGILKSNRTRDAFTVKSLSLCHSEVKHSLQCWKPKQQQSVCQSISCREEFYTQLDGGKGGVHNKPFQSRLLAMVAKENWKA